MKYLKEGGLLLLIFLGLIGLLLLYYLKDDENMKNIKLNIVPTAISKIEENSIWCPTLELIWNDMKNQVIGQDIIFIGDEENILAKDLNKESFKEMMISDEYYYKNYGYMTPSFKELIKEDIWHKFNEKSDILDKFNFAENSYDYFFYSMLVRKFTFLKPFDILSDSTFGINEHSRDELNENVRVLFYDDNGYAVKLLTTSGDEVILYKGDRKETFNDTYQMIVNQSNESDFNLDDTLTVANINFKSESNYQELTNKKFYDINGVEHTIDEIIQTIMFNLDNTGGKVKSEAGMSVKFTSVSYGRHFDFNDDFVLFLKETKHDKPYLALNVTDINEFY